MHEGELDGCGAFSRTRWLAFVVGDQHPVVGAGGERTTKRDRDFGGERGGDSWAVAEHHA